MELDCSTQKYAWGKLGLRSAVASLSASANPEFRAEADSPYAELWMGTHPNGPSVIRETGESLAAHVRRNPHVLGEKSRGVFGDDLPFLFKVLSVNKALSIQAHPNKRHAEQLHSERPDVYKDPNHKPEMAIALTPFEGLCGFRPLDEIQAFIQSIPQLSRILGEEPCTALLAADDTNCESALKQAFVALMSASKSSLEAELDALRASTEAKEDKSSVDELFLRLCGQYPGDVGCFVLFFVNHVSLQPGEAMFLGPNLIHAYLAGDCIECMACSDNVVRAGLTPKLIDVPTLCGMLEYKCAPGQDMKFKPVVENEHSTLYRPGVPDFAVAKYVIGTNESVALPARDSASIILVVEGHGLASTLSVKKGTVLFVPSEQVLDLKNSADEDMLAFQAFC